ncbi:proteolipid membrane potential modulator domain-containing protein [Ditylenchus destructor]|nr:proteolipid membrane potential modulator domain-containing protein [Ditylenchus destructor]
MFSIDFGRFISLQTETKQTYSNSEMPLTCSDCPKIFCSLLLPPLGVWMEKGCSIHLLVNILLTLLGYFPGIIHAIFIIFYY